MRVKVKRLSAKQYPSGTRYYWQPTPAERRAGWKGQTLGSDPTTAIVAAEKLNASIDEWREGGAKPRAVTAHRKRQTVGHAIARYRDEVLAKQSKNTQRTAGTPLKRLDYWAGDKPIAWVTRARVRALRDAMLQPKEQGGIGHHPAFHVLERGRILWRWFMDEELATANPFERFGLSKPAPRQVYWEERHLSAFAAAARKIAAPSVAAAIEIGYYFGQREADNLALPLTAWREIPRTKFRADPAVWDTLASEATTGPDAGTVMGIYVRQGKTKRWVGIPAEGEARKLIEAQIAIARQTGRTTILGDERNGGAPWDQRTFIDRFAEVRAQAAGTAREAGDTMLAEELDGLWYGDLRRSCVVYLGELGMDDPAIAAITGHSLATVKAILEIYMPRTEGMAGRAIAARRDARGDTGNVVDIAKSRISD